MIEKKEIALMYSGGLDTTYTALQLAEEFSKVHLLTFCNGFCVRVGASKTHVGLLQKRFGSDKFEHSIISVAQILSFLKKGLVKDMVKAHSPLLFDLCCRLSMETAAVFYCLDRGIKYATDGNNPDTQGEIFLQQEKYLKLTAAFFLGYGIQYFHPVKQLESRQRIIKQLEAAGIKTGKNALGKIGITTQLFTQPFCLWAPLTFFFTSKLRKVPGVGYFAISTEDAIAYRLKKEKLAKEVIDYLKLNSSVSHVYPCKKNNLSKLFKFIYRKR
jgi:hypothetical protein